MNTTNIKFLNENIAIISDTHFGIQINNPIWQNIPLQYAKWLKEKLINFGIKDIIICGDIFNNREEISVLTLHLANEFFKILKDFNIVLIVGNHDMFYKNRNDINSINILNEWDNIHVINNISYIEQFDRKICLVPWLCDIQKIEKSDILFGHFEIKNFKINKYSICESNLASETLLNKAKLIFSGHFHINQERIYEKGTIIYVGCTYHQNWSDYETTKGFYTLNLKNLNYNFINNDHSATFQKIYLSNLIKNGITDKIKKMFFNNFIRLVIDLKNISPEKIDTLYTKLCLLKPLTLDIEHKNELLINNCDNLDFDKDTYDFVKNIKDFINSLEIENKNDVTNYIVGLYNKSNSEKDIII